MDAEHRLYRQTSAGSEDKNKHALAGAKQSETGNFHTNWLRSTSNVSCLKLSVVRLSYPSQLTFVIHRNKITHFKRRNVIARDEGNGDYLIHMTRKRRLLADVTIHSSTVGLNKLQLFTRIQKGSL